MFQYLRERLLRAADESLHCILQGEEHLYSFSAFWATVESDFSLAVAHQNIDAETIALGHDVALFIDCIARCALDINAKHDELYHDLEQIIQGINGAQISDGTPCESSSLQTPTSSSPKDEDHDFYPPFLAPAYHWLLRNLHNPYPSTDFKATLARNSGCSIGAISSWFANVRRRMGWTAICRDHFRNARADAIHAASKILTKDDLHHTFPPELVHAFVAMRVNAQELYSSLFSRSVLAGDIDSVVKNISQMDKELPSDAACRVTGGLNSVHLCVEGRRQGCNSTRTKEMAEDIRLSSPHCPHSSSPVPALDSSLTDDSEDEDEVLPPILAGRKRRSLDSESDVSTSSKTTTRRIKRLRPSSFCSASSASPYSTSTSLNSLKGMSDISQTNIHASSRKRRLSNADINDISKRPRSISPPRLHTLSDPLPQPRTETEHSVDDWFNTNFDALFALPPPVDAIEPDLSTQWEIELFDYGIPQGLQKRQSKSSLSPIRDKSSPAPEDFAELEDLLRSMDNGEQGQSTIFSEASLSQDFPPSLCQPIDWTALLSNEELLTPTIDSIYPHPSPHSLPLSDIDLSILQLPGNSPTASLQTTSNELASRHVKLQQLQVMQEAVRRIEKELQSEGIST